jgi:hypothetical protein
MTLIEEREIKGITLKNILVTFISTISIVGSIMFNYFQLKGDIQDVKSTQETTNRVNEIRLKVLESQVSLLQDQVREITSKK